MDEYTLCTVRYPNGVAYEFLTDPERTLAEKTQCAHPPGAAASRPLPLVALKLSAEIRFRAWWAERRAVGAGSAAPAGSGEELARIAYSYEERVPLAWLIALLGEHPEWLTSLPPALEHDSPTPETALRRHLGIAIEDYLMAVADELERETA